MKLYQINQAVMDLLNQCVDDETGEYKPTPMQEAELLQLGMEKDKVMQYLAEEVLNERSDQNAINNEIMRLNIKKEDSEKREQSLLKIIDREAMGENQDFGIAKWSYRSTPQTIIDDNSKAIEFCLKNIPDAVKTLGPELLKTPIKNWINAGNEMPYAHIENIKKGNLK